MTPMEKALRREIRDAGPLTVEAFMARALNDPHHGYYSARDPLGEAGDFTTAPEISQMFGEIIGLWCVDCWMRMGEPAAVRLVELGPGRGTLMADALRATRIVPGFAEAARVHLVETNTTLRERQRQTLAGHAPPHAPLHTLQWHAAFGDVPPGPLLLIANEFFDALPIRQFVRAEGRFRERLVGLDESGALTFTLAEETVPDPVLPASAETANDGDIVESAPAAIGIVRVLAERLARDGGAALIVDYGPARSAPGNSLQAVKRHRYHDALKDVGEADLTAHVDFEALAGAARSAGAAAYGPITQAQFLESLGLEARAARLLRHADSSQAIAISKALERLTGRRHMGTLFKVLCLADPESPPPPPFEAPHAH